MEAGVIHDMLSAIRKGSYENVHAVLLAKSGRLVLEEYFHGYDRDQVHPIRSATKSIASVLMGIALDQGCFSSVEEPVCPYLKDRASHWDSRARSVTIQSILTMTSGFDCDDHRGESFRCEKAMARTEDWVDFAINLPMAHEPGKHWAYNSASLFLLNEVIAQTLGLSVPQFADTHLLRPLGIQGFRWSFDPKGRAWLGGGAAMRPMDMVKFGQMCLEKGVWHDRRIVSEKWLSEATRCHAHSGYGQEYGYLWWLGRQEIHGRSFKAFWALGNGGQAIFVCPDVELVAVFTGGNYNSLLELQFMGLLIDYIFPAILGPKPEKPYLIPSDATRKELSGTHRCNDLQLDLFVKEKSLYGRLEGLEAPLLFENQERFSMANPIFGNMTGRILKDENNRLLGLCLNGAFSQMHFPKAD